ncbi:hypothetical protein OS493_022500, partial [Desmophyllum pertusum]
LESCGLSHLNAIAKLLLGISRRSSNEQNRTNNGSDPNDDLSCWVTDKGPNVELIFAMKTFGKRMVKKL